MDGSQFIMCSTVCILILTITFLFLRLNGEIIAYDCIYYTCAQYFGNSTINSTAGLNEHVKENSLTTPALNRTLF
jgi:hypothetical protein